MVAMDKGIINAGDLRRSARQKLLDKGFDGVVLRRDDSVGYTAIALSQKSTVPLEKIKVTRK